VAELSMSSSRWALSMTGLYVAIKICEAYLVEGLAVLLTATFLREHSPDPPAPIASSPAAVIFSTPDYPMVSTCVDAGGAERDWTILHSRARQGV
jgi:hypothetical protein